jgi:F-type H+-transporting ATPase subunit epsilon
MHCLLITPEATLRDMPAEFVALTLSDGEIGIAPGHTPLIGRLGYGEMRITQAGDVERFYVEGGFVEVLNDTVTVLTGRAMPAEALDEALAREELGEAQRQPATTPEALATRDRAIAQSRARLRVARRAQ